MMMQKGVLAAILALVTTGLVLTLATSALLSSTQNVPLNGTVSAVNVGVYSDSACTMNCSSISVGTIRPGNSYIFNMYVKNSGNVPMTLSISTSDWYPSSANGPVQLTWNREDYRLVAGASIKATLTLTVSSSISTGITAFGFNIAITGIGIE